MPRGGSATLVAPDPRNQSACSVFGHVSTEIRCPWQDCPDHGGREGHRSADRAAYTASKAGVEAFADAPRSELAHTGTAVGVAYFSFIDTDMVRETLRPAEAEESELTTAQPTG
jgi:NAD(P)-dependent dehydrogenase (short-subunit alcohol dehydrogenase family)